MASLVTLLLIPHLIAVNIASVAPLVCIPLELASARGNATAARLAGKLAWHGVWMLLAGTTLGVIIGGMLWNDAYRGSLKLLGSRLHYGGAELLFSLLLMIAHAVWWSRKPAASQGGRWGRALLALLAGTNVIYHFPVLMVILARIASGADPLDAPLDSPAFRARLVSPEVAARCVHIWFASFAVTGAWMMALAWNWQRRSTNSSDFDEADAGKVARWGARLAVVPTLLQIPSGLWLLSTLSPLQQSSLFGGDAAATSAFVASVLISLWLLHQLAAIGMGDTSRRPLAQALLTLVSVIALMTFVLRHLETIR